VRGSSSGARPVVTQTHYRLCTKKTCKCKPFSRAADGIRTHDLLHGKQNVRFRGSQESPGKERFLSYKGSATLPSFYREIAGVSGLKPDWESCRFGRRVRSRTVRAHPATRSRFGLRGCRCGSSTRRSRRLRIGSLQTACISSDEGVRVLGSPVLRCRTAARNRTRVRGGWPCGRNAQPQVRMPPTARPAPRGEGPGFLFCLRGRCSVPTACQAGGFVAILINAWRVWPSSFARGPDRGTGRRDHAYEEIAQHCRPSATTARRSEPRRRQSPSQANNRRSTAVGNRKQSMEDQ
jgi:hypothetical protein